jgi:hypothetical protein
VQCHRKGLGCQRRQQHGRPVEQNLGTVAARDERRQFAAQHRSEIGSRPSRFCQKSLRAGERGDPPFHRLGEGRHGLGAGEPQHRLHHREGVLGAVVHLAHEQRLALLGSLRAVMSTLTPRIGRPGRRGSASGGRAR